jgi:hypothetical protein
MEAVDVEQQKWAESTEAVEVEQQKGAESMEAVEIEQRKGADVAGRSGAPPPAGIRCCHRPLPFPCHLCFPLRCSIGALQRPLARYTRAISRARAAPS